MPGTANFPFRIPVISVCALALLLLPLKSSRAQSASGESPADIVLINGKIITVDAKDSIVPALSIHNGKIAAIGSNEKILALAPQNARVIDLRGRTVTPALIDPHPHLHQPHSLSTLQLTTPTST